MKPIIVGMNNPYSDNPDMALAPYPDRSSGYRLWSMLKLAVENNPVSMAAYRAGINKADYMEAFDRYNLFGKLAPATRALRKLAAEDFLSKHVPEGSHVILLGHMVLRAVSDALDPVSLDTLPLIHPQVVGGVTWRWLPHPSGRSTIYNDPAIRTLAGMTLADVLSHCSTGE